MLSYRLSLSEQETHISFTRDSDTANVYTSDRLEMAKLDKLARTFPNHYKIVWVDSQILGDGQPMGKKYTVPKRYIRYGKPASDAQRAASARSIARINSKAQK